MIMVSSAMINIGPLDLRKDVVPQLQAGALEEHVSILQYITGIIKHFACGDDHSRIHFYQDGSGDAHNEDVPSKIDEETMGDSRARLSYCCETAEERLALLKMASISVGKTQ
jgi:hypothetical protein